MRPLHANVGTTAAVVPAIPVLSAGFALLGASVFGFHFLERGGQFLLFGLGRGTRDGRRLDAGAFLRGYEIAAGTRLGT